MRPPSAVSDSRDVDIVWPLEWLLWYQRARFDQMTRTAGEMFYTMKQVEIQVSELEEVVAETKRKDLMERILTKRQKLRELETQYDRFLTELDIYEGMGEQDRLVFRMARLFGECEVAMPRDFLSEVKKYIRFIADRRLVRDWA